MNIYENIKLSNTSTCINCFENTKRSIQEFFDFIDCNDDGLINAENIYDAMKQMKLIHKL